MKKRLKYVDVNGIKIEPRLFEAAVHSGGISVGFGDEVPYDENYPWFFDAAGPIEPVHVATWNFFKGGIRPRKEGEVIHHIDGDKLNSLVENLGIGSPRIHGLAHAARRQKFTPRKRWRLDGLYRPRAEEPVRELGFKEEMRFREQLLAREAAREEQQKRLLDWRSSPRPPSSALSPGALDGDDGEADDRRAVENILAGHLPRLRAELDHLDTGQKVPPPARRPRRRDRLLGIGRIRRGCTPGEAALVRFLVKNGFDRLRAAREAGVPVEVVEKMLREPAVDLAIRNWMDHGRLPPPSAPKKLRPYLGKAATTT